MASTVSVFSLHILHSIPSIIRAANLHHQLIHTSLGFRHTSEHHLRQIVAQPSFRQRSNIIPFVSQSTVQMCGRYQLNVSASALQAARPNTAWRPGHQQHHSQRHQVRPTTTAPVLVAAESTATTADAAAHVPAELVIMKVINCLQRLTFRST